jgi:uncharacterized protein (TIGR02646 family)
LEQHKGLCIYCEQQLPKKTGAEHLPDAIIEHIRPRTKSKYPELTYIFCNLSVACKKNKKIDDKNEDIDFCEDRKKDEYDEQLFLNPHEVEDIESYFEYDIEGRIFPKNNNPKADYMIKKVLNLDHNELNRTRGEQLSIYFEMELEMGVEAVKEIFSVENANQLPAFYSMLKQLFM